MILDEKALLEKLRRIEALHAGATTPGERVEMQAEIGAGNVG